MTNKRRIIFDARGRPVVEVPGLTGRFETQLDRERIRELRGDELDVAETARMVRPKFPYGEAGAGTSKSMKQRNALDYMRALGEEIKRRRTRGDT